MRLCLSLVLAVTAAGAERLSTLERMRPENLARVRGDRERLARQRREIPQQGRYRDIRAILHCHAEDASHTGGTRAEVLAAAKKAGVSVVLLSDHVRPPRDYIEDSWRGLREGVLFVPGSEAEGFLNYPMRSIRGENWTSREEYISLIRRNGGLIFLSHPEERLEQPMEQLDGLEIYNRHADANDEAEFLRWFRKALATVEGWKQLSRLLAEYREEFFGAQQDYPAAVLARWDQESQKRPLTGVAANDAHHNQVFWLTRADEGTAIIDSVERKNLGQVRVGPGEELYRLDFDPYEVSFRNVSTHLWVESLTEEAVRAALRAGRAYVAHDWLCDPTGFRFEREGEGLTAVSPVRTHFRLFRNGVVIHEEWANRLRWELTAPGVYRLELWLEAGGERRPWVYSNPVRVER